MKINRKYHIRKKGHGSGKIRRNPLFSEEYVGDGDRAIRFKGRDFPLVFMCNRFSGIGWDLYYVTNPVDYQNFLFNDEFVAVGSKYNKFANANNLVEARKKAKGRLRGM